LHRSDQSSKEKISDSGVEASVIVFARCIFVKKMREIKLIYFWRDRD